MLTRLSPKRLLKSWQLYTLEARTGEVYWYDVDFIFGVVFFLYHFNLCNAKIHFSQKKTTTKRHVFLAGFNHFSSFTGQCWTKSNVSGKSYVHIFYLFAQVSFLPFL